MPQVQEKICFLFAFNSQTSFFLFQFAFKPNDCYFQLEVFETKASFSVSDTYCTYKKRPKLFRKGQESNKYKSRHKKQEENQVTINHPMTFFLTLILFLPSFCFLEKFKGRKEKVEKVVVWPEYQLISDLLR